MKTTPLRTRIDLNEGWLFKRSRVTNRWMKQTAMDGEQVRHPHCWNANDTFKYEYFSYTGTGAYKLQFELPENDGATRWRLRSEGFYGLAEVWLDEKPFDLFGDGVPQSELADAGRIDHPSAEGEFQ